MLTKIVNYKEVIVFYILLAVILLLVSNHNKQIDMHVVQNKNVIVHY